MKMLFFSADRAEVESVSNEFTQAGIACEVRKGSGPAGRPTERELWIRDDGDCHRAFLLCVEHGIGFAKRSHPVSEFEFDA